MVDLAIDGADEIQPGSLALIKGRGGALTREKIVAANSRRFVVVADDSKLVRHLGSHAPLPVEVTAFGHQTVAARLRALGSDPVLRLAANGRPYVTSNRNLIYDCHGILIADPSGLEAAIATIAGVVTAGLFCKLAASAIIGSADGRVQRLEAS